MATGHKTPGSGRKKGTPNKLKAPTLKVIAEKLVQDKLAAQQAQLDGVLQEQTMLELVVSFARDSSYPPGFRLDAAKAALPYLHSKKAEETSDGDPVVISRVERIIVRAPDNPHDPARLPAPHEIVEPGEVRSSMPAAQEPAPWQSQADLPDAVTRARGRLDRMRGIN
jgi:hypothetical protein